jgi:putative methyltransferase (TIGR01177 family)
LTPRSLSQHISGRSANRILFLLSGEDTGIPGAEARALVRMQDPSASFSAPQKRLLLATTTAEPSAIENRVAYSRRVGPLLADGVLGEDALRLLRAGTYAVRVFKLDARDDSEGLISDLAGQVDGRVALDRPERELTVVRGKRDYFALTRPSSMRQDWVVRRPRARAFFHPSAIFPKFSRLLVNLSGVMPGETFLDPFCGTGSLLLEAAEIGASPLGVDLHSKMTRGALSNRDRFGQDWLAVIRADSRRIPLTSVDAIATDIPYGRVSTTSGSSSRAILENLIKEASSLLSDGRRLVVMHPKTLDVGRTEGFELEEELHLVVHKKLTRTISVLRRSGH